MIEVKGGHNIDKSQLFGITTKKRIPSRKKDKYNGPQVCTLVTNSMRDSEEFQKGYRNVEGRKAVG